MHILCRHRQLEHFMTAIREFEQYLANVVSIRRMVTHEMRSAVDTRVARYDELFQFIRFCVTGENHPVRLPEIPMYLDWLVTAEFQHGLTPMVDNRFLGVVAIDGFPAESWPGILNALDLMPLTYRWSSRFVFLDAEEARARLERTRKKWQQKVRPFFDQLFQTQCRSVDQDAMMMVAETEDAIAEASSQLVAYGYYTPVIVMFDDRRSAAAGKVRGRPPADPGRRFWRADRNAERHGCLSRQPAGRLLRQYPRAADQHPQSRRSHSAELGLVGQLRPRLARSIRQTPRR